MWFQITNQMITACKAYITDNGAETVWSQSRDEVLKKLKDSIKLNMEYQRQFHKTKVHIKLNSKLNQKLKNPIKNSRTLSNSTRSINSWKCNCKHHHLLPQNPFLTCEQGLIGWVMYSEDSLLLKIYDMLSNRYIYNNFEIGKQLREM